LTEVLVALIVAAGVLVAGWLLITGRQFLSRTRVRGPAESPVSGDAGDAEWIYGDRAVSDRRARRAFGEPGEGSREVPHDHVPVQTMSAEGDAEAIPTDAEHEERLAAAEREALEIRTKAEREAEAILKDAELKAGEALTGVERARGRLEEEIQEVAREQARMAAKQKRLSELLLKALEEIEGASANGSTNIGGLQELRDALRSTEEPLDRG
jgi:hypothetical protein